MKKLFLLSAFALCCTLFSCTTDDLASTDKTSEVKRNIDLNDKQALSGPEDEPVIVPPPPRKP